jgi:hypothetical protein
MHAPNPMTARVMISTSSGAVSGKNMSHHESNEPSPGSPPYFMSVMKAWLSRNGPTQNISSSTALTPTVSAYVMRVRSIQTREKMTAARTTKIITMPCETHAAAMRTDAHTRYLPVWSPAASTPSASTASDSAIECENSPAIVDFTLPP